MGRKETYGDDIKDEILNLLRTGMSLKAICDSDPKFPDVATVLRFCERDEKFAQNYTHARKIGWLAIADSMLEIVDEPGDPNDKRLRFQARQWFLSKCLPKIYGEKLEVEHSGEITTKTYEVRTLTPEFLERKAIAVPDFAALPTVSTQDGAGNEVEDWES